MAETKILGWIGLGAMGLPMATRLVESGYRILGFDTNAVRLQLFRDVGGEAAPDVASLRNNVDYLFSMAWDDASLIEIATQLCERPFSAPPRLKGFVDLSTISTEGSERAARIFSATGIDFLRCPVSGSVAVAERGELSLFVSGPPIIFDLVRPYLSKFSSVQSYVGSGEEARVIKLAVNLLVQMNTATLGEAMSFALQGGVDLDTFLEAVNSSVIASPHYKIRGDALKSGNMHFGGPGVAHKDIAIAMRVASSQGTVLPIATLVQLFLRQIQTKGSGRNAIMELLTHMTSQQIGELK